MNHPSKRNTNGYAQISKNNKIISLDNLTIGEEITLQSPKTIAVCEIKKFKKNNNILSLYSLKYINFIEEFA